MSNANLAKAELAWGVSLPDWIRVLAEACDATSQTRVAKQVGRSGSLISSLLSNTYTGNLGTTESVVRGALMGSTIDCPVVGEITTDVCVGHRNHTGAVTANPDSIRLSRRCPHCPNNPKSGGQGC